jgi:hypothetical protein
LTQARLSPDGKLVAAEASECGKRDSFIVIFDVKTGREVGRRKVKYSNSEEMAFLPGSNVLVMRPHEIGTDRFLENSVFRFSTVPVYAIRVSQQ